jgi:hypothetical protein
LLTVSVTRSPILCQNRLVPGSSSPSASRTELPWPLPLQKPIALCANSTMKEASRERCCSVGMKVEQRCSPQRCTTRGEKSSRRRLLVRRQSRALKPMLQLMTESSRWRRASKEHYWSGVQKQSSPSWRFDSPTK